MENSFENENWKEERSVCRYCGQNLSQDMPYCSEECRKHDSPWNWAGD